MCGRRRRRRSVRAARGIRGRRWCGRCGFLSRRRRCRCRLLSDDFFLRRLGRDDFFDRRRCLRDFFRARRWSSTAPPRTRLGLGLWLRFGFRRSLGLGLRGRLGLWFCRLFFFVGSGRNRIGGGARAATACRRGGRCGGLRRAGALFALPACTSPRHLFVGELRQVTADDDIERPKHGDDFVARNAELCRQIMNPKLVQTILPDALTRERNRRFRESLLPAARRRCQPPPSLPCPLPRRAKPR